MENKKVLKATFFNSGSNKGGDSFLYTLIIFKNKGMKAMRGRNSIIDSAFMKK